MSLAPRARWDRGWESWGISTKTSKSFFLLRSLVELLKIPVAQVCPFGFGRNYSECSDACSVTAGMILGPNHNAVSLHPFNVEKGISMALPIWEDQCKKAQGPGGGCGPVVEHLPCNCEALGLMPRAQSCTQIKQIKKSKETWDTHSDTVLPASTWVSLVSIRPCRAGETQVSDTCSISEQTSRKELRLWRSVLSPVLLTSLPLLPPLPN